MKKFIVTIIAALFTVVSMAQTFGEETINGKVYTVVNMQSESTELGDIKILLEPSSAKKFIKNLRKLQDKVAGWTETANKKGVKNFRKTVEGSYSYSKLAFCNSDGNNVADYNYNNYLVPYFNVDSEGNSHLLLGGYYSGYNTSNMGSDYDKRTKFFFYMSIPVSELNSWINNLEIAANEINGKQHNVDAVNEIFMAVK